MANKLIISQVFLPNAKQAQNFVSIYEESVRHDNPAVLFLLLEIKGDKRRSAQDKKEEYEKIASQIARTLKQTFLSEGKLTEVTFEKALSNINAELSQMAQKGVVTWYKRLNALIAAHIKSTLFVSATGSCTAYLLRGREFTLISEPVSPGTAAHPMKTFMSFSSGSLAENDHVIFSTSGLYNYISLEKLRASFQEQPLDSSVKGVIEMLKQDAPQEAFAAFICRLSTRLALPDTELYPLFTPASHTIIDDADNFERTSTKRSLMIAQSVGATGWLGIKKLFVFFQGIASQYFLPGRPTSQAAPTKRISRKTILIAIAVVVVVFAVSLIYSNLHNATIQAQTDTRRQLETAGQNITDAEASLIYDDQQRATDSYLKAAVALDAVKRTSYLKDEVLAMTEKLDALNRKLNKTTLVESLETLGKFISTPDHLIKTASGFIALNSFTDALEYFDNKSRSVTDFAIAVSSHENFVAAGQIADNRAGFFSATGKIYEVSAPTDAIRAMTATSTANYTIKAASFFGTRAYAVDAATGQILRYESDKTGFALPKNWLKQSNDFKDAVSLAIDGNLWVLGSSNLKKFTKGELQPFVMATLATPLRDPVGIVTDQASPRLFVIDPNNKRIVVFNKEGGLMNQYTAPQFNELKDIVVDEVARQIYAITGAELVRFSF